MAKKKKQIRFIIIFLIFVIYFLMAARPIPHETVLSLYWISSLSGSPTMEDDVEFNFPAVTGQLLPFTLGNYFGYVDSYGQFVLNKSIINDIYLSPNMWTEYNAEPSSIVINNILERTQINIENAGGYPVLLDNRVFILGSEQNALSEISNSGNLLWTYEFGAPLTCIDAAAGFLVTGSLDGAIEVFNSSGERIFNFPTDGSRYTVILGVAMSRNGSRIGVICGIDEQRFLLLERLGNTGGDYKVVYHEYLGTGFRQPVRIQFIEDDQRIVYEREGGIGCYNIRSRRGMLIPLDGKIAAIDESGDEGHFFVITSHPMQERKLIGIKFPPDRLFGTPRTRAEDSIFLKASFKSDDVFFGRTRTYSSRTGSSGTDDSPSMIVVGGGTALISFELGEN